MVCVRCGAAVEKGASLCLSCTQQGHQVLKCDFIKSTSTFYPIGTVLESPFGHPDGRSVISNPASGGQSVSKVDDNGTFQAKLSGSLNLGTSNEPHVIKILIQVLKAEDKDVSLIPGARDDRGQDALLSINDCQVEVQIVTIPAEPKLWKELADSKTSSRSGDRAEAVRLVREALEHKENKAEGALLVIDASHVSAMVGHKLIDDYISKHGNPTDEFSFKEVLIIGPTVKSSMRLETTVQPSHAPDM